MISTANVTMQFGEKPLFENISVKFQSGNRYGLIGANGCGKSTLMKILTGELKPTHGSVLVGEGQRLGVLSQDQFAFEKYRVVDTVIMGHKKLWQIKEERDRIYSLPEMSEEDGIKVAELEMEFAEMDGYSAESSASELLLGLDIPLDQHYGLMSEIAPGWKLRVLLAQALFSDPEILLLDEPTNNLDINSIRWLEEVLSARKSTMVIISHDRHFLNGVCTHMADLDYGALNVFPGSYDDFMIAATAIQERMRADNAKKEEKIKDLKHFVSRFSANASKSKQATSRLKQLNKIELDDIKPSSRVSPYIIFNQSKELFRNVLEVQGLSKGYDGEQVLKDIKNKVDVHSYTAKILGVSRQKAKSDTFKPLYGGILGTPKQMQYYRAFKNKYSGISSWHRELQNEALMSNKIRLPSGRQYFFPNVERLRSGSVTNSTAIKNYPVQGFATADLLPLALINLNKLLTKNELKSIVCNTVHDSIVLDVYPDEDKQAIETLKEAMLSISDECEKRYGFKYTMPIGIELKIGNDCSRPAPLCPFKLVLLALSKDVL